MSDTEFDPQSFRRALGCFPTGVAVITTVDPQGRPVGLTCNSFASVSLEPPLVSWSLRSVSGALPAFREAGRFAINVLMQTQDALSRHFASRDVADKFQNLSYKSGLGGMPLLNECVATFECRTVAEHIAGDHSIFIGQVERHSYSPREPLVFFRGEYSRLTESLRAFIEAGNVSAAELDQAREILYAALARLACSQATEQDLDAIQVNLRLLEDLDAQGRRQERREATREFFRLIAAASHNRVLSVVLESVTQILQMQIANPLRLLPNPAIMKIRHEILQNLRARDGEATVAAMRRYIELARITQADSVGAP